MGYNAEAKIIFGIEVTDILDEDGVPFNFTEDMEEDFDLAYHGNAFSDMRVFLIRKWYGFSASELMDDFTKFVKANNLDIKDVKWYLICSYG